MVQSIVILLDTDTGKLCLELLKLWDGSGKPPKMAGDYFGKVRKGGLTLYLVDQSAPVMLI